MHNTRSGPNRTIYGLHVSLRNMKENVREDLGDGTWKKTA